MRIGSTEKTGKNGLIELMRFLFALWVLYYHSYVPYKSGLFSDGFLAVEFFFVLSGFFLMRSIDKYSDAPLGEGLIKFLKHRAMAIALPFIIGEVFVLVFSFSNLDEIPSNFLFGYLWYVRDLFIAMTVIFLSRRWIKSDAAFYITMAALSVTALFVLRFIPILAWPSGPFRSIGAIPVGMLCALIPKFKISDGKRGEIITAAVASAALAVVSAAALTVIIPSSKTLLLHYALVLVCYPALLYFASILNVKSRFLNWLGSLSFPIYSFQCIIRVIEDYGFGDRAALFYVLMALVLAFSLALHLYKRKSKA
ncbi:MAG: acyltransferase [Clostridia bacterium]|nr:acyltransferase [Clostridia bacterium]